MSEVYNCLEVVGRGCCRRGMLQVPTQGIAQWVERWSFVSMGKDME